jgi:hypothetical protein
MILIWVKTYKSNSVVLFVLDSIKQKFRNTFFSILTAKAMMAIRMTYMLKKNWKGDPCAPKAFVWDGLNCSYSSSGPASITSL